MKVVVRQMVGHPGALRVDPGAAEFLGAHLPEEEIQALEALPGAEINEAKKRLADEATRLCHGEDAQRAAAATAQQAFEAGVLAGDIPVHHVPKARLEEGVAAFQLFAEAGLAKSGSEARRLIRGGGARINQQPVADEQQTVTIADITPQGYIQLSVGKKRHVRVCVQEV